MVGVPVLNDEDEEEGEIEGEIVVVIVDDILRIGTVDELGFVGTGPADFVKFVA